ncbi:glycosyltransferase family 1 protein [Cryobacterium cheniae]|uniref:Glycosyltransferase family 1 protein n=1 Tax=Cryobacterium cheniae TaxID=1259262 RepID=A0A4R8XWA5_9MICO|nr:glycosyltransferase [Cryobacterium cheniae]TFC82991.1 glycosyltransferase family 1 protein [Cryobacterium cheniae]
MVDSSAFEVGQPVGVAEARSAYGGSLPAENQIILVIGMLGPGKHVDSFLHMWNEAPIEGASLVFAGVAEPPTHEALRSAAETNVGIVYISGRLTDVVFDHLLESADVVAAVYRYSASSGVALRALALGTALVVGGSKVLTTQLRGTPGVVVAEDTSAAELSRAIRIALGTRVPPLQLDPNNSAVFPRPIVESILKAEST